MNLAYSLTPTDSDRLRAAEAQVRGYCGWHIAPVQQDTVTVPWRDGVAVLPTLQLVSVDLVVDATGATLDASTYTASRAGVLRRIAHTAVPPTHTWGACCTDSHVVVTYTHGYEQPPADVVAAVQALAQQAKNGAPGLQSRTTGPFSYTYASGDALGQQRNVLDRYRLPPRP